METIKGCIPFSHIKVENLSEYAGKTVTIYGTVYKIREMSGFAFVLIRTRTGIVQCVYTEDAARFKLADIKDNMAVTVSGEVAYDSRSRAGVEIRLIACEVLSVPAEESPVVINNKEVTASLDTLLDYRPLTLRNEKERAIFSVQSGICKGFRHFFDEHGFTEIHSPKIVSSGAEGGANVFKLDYFGNEAYLAQSPQFYKQIMAGVFERVYEIAPVFRAEKHDTSRHVNEYTSVDLEMGFINSFYDIMKLETLMLEQTMQFVKERYSEELSLLKAEIPVVAEIPHIPFLEAKQMIEKHYNRAAADYLDFEPEEEKLLCDLVKKRTGSEFVFVTHYKSSKRPFYAMDSPNNQELTESFDLLFRGVEITTGGQRVHDYNTQIEKMRKRGMSIDLFKSYLMAHKYGLPPHGGFGLGLERFTACLLGFVNVRRATLFPRDTRRLEP